VYKIQNTSPISNISEFEISGISATTYYNDLLPRLQKELKRNNLNSAKDSTIIQHDVKAFVFKFYLEKERVVNISQFIGYYKIFANEVFDSGGNFSLDVYDNQKRVSIYQYSKNTKSNLFETKRNYILLKKYLYQIK
jgi:hypothetical protein